MIHPAWTIAATLAWTEDYLTRHAIPDARLEAEILLAHILRSPRLELLMRGDEPVADHHLARYKELILQRKLRVPVAYLTGEREFMELTFSVNRHTLIPRPETELLAEEAIKRLKMGLRPVVVDVGAGSGCIGLSIAHARPDATVYCTDISIDALHVVWQNATRYGMAGRTRLSRGTLLEPLKSESLENGVDLIISNPPYIPSAELTGLAPELGYEPAGALDGGPDGLTYYKTIARDAMRFLKPEGLLMFELNDTLAADIVSVVQHNGLTCEPLIKDYSGFDRILVSGRGNHHG